MMKRWFCSWYSAGDLSMTLCILALGVATSVEFDLLLFKCMVLDMVFSFLCC